MLDKRNRSLSEIAFDFFGLNVQISIAARVMQTIVSLKILYIKLILLHIPIFILWKFMGYGELRSLSKWLSLFTFFIITTLTLVRHFFPDDD